MFGLLKVESEFLLSFISCEEPLQFQVLVSPEQRLRPAVYEDAILLQWYNDCFTLSKVLFLQSNNTVFDQTFYNLWSD